MKKGHFSVKLIALLVMLACSLPAANEVCKRLTRQTLGEWLVNRVFNPIGVKLVHAGVEPTRSPSRLERAFNEPIRSATSAKVISVSPPPPPPELGAAGRLPRAVKVPAENTPAVRATRIGALEPLTPMPAVPYIAWEERVKSLVLSEKPVRSEVAEVPLPRPAPRTAIPRLVVPDHTAVYDISAHKVYMPDGTVLEAHSGVGAARDNLREVGVKNRGPTPPNVYLLSLREPLFHGIQAIRLNPVDERKMHGRDGILAHPYMMGVIGQSNGCVSFKNYQPFLDAFLNGKVTRLVVVPSNKSPPLAVVARNY